MKQPMGRARVHFIATPWAAADAFRRSLFPSQLTAGNWKIRLNPASPSLCRLKMIRWRRILAPVSGGRPVVKLYPKGKPITFKNSVSGTRRFLRIPLILSPNFIRVPMISKVIHHKNWLVFAVICSFWFSSAHAGYTGPTVAVKVVSSGSNASQPVINNCLFLN